MKINLTACQQFVNSDFSIPLVWLWHDDDEEDGNSVEITERALLASRHDFMLIEFLSWTLSWLDTNEEFCANQKRIKLTSLDEDEERIGSIPASFSDQFYDFFPFDFLVSFN